MHLLTLVAFLFVFTLSFALATFLGHVVHWSLHQRWTGPFRKGHLQHHVELYPPDDLISERYRASKWYNSGPLLFAPVFVVIMLVAGAITWKLGWPVWVIVTLCANLLGFGFFNDYVHDSFHIKDHWLGRFKWWKDARDLHFIHHMNMRVNFGIVLFSWDKVFKTLRSQTLKVPRLRW